MSSFHAVSNTKMALIVMSSFHAVSNTKMALQIPWVQFAESSFKSNY
jgi:hypothetical protein